MVPYYGFFLLIGGREPRFIIGLPPGIFGKRGYSGGQPFFLCGGGDYPKGYCANKPGFRAGV